MYNNNMLTEGTTASISVRDALQHKLITDRRNFPPLYILHNVQVHCLLLKH